MFGSRTKSKSNEMPPLGAQEVPTFLSRVTIGGVHLSGSPPTSTMMANLAHHQPQLWWQTY